MLTKEQMHSIVGELWVENSPKIFEFLTKYADTKEKQDACLQTIRDRQAVNRIWVGPDRRVVLRGVRRAATYIRWSIQVAAAAPKLVVYASR